MYMGGSSTRGKPKRVYASIRHPYTRAMLVAVPSVSLEGDFSEGGPWTLD